MPTERIEDYLESIYIVINEKGYAKGRDLAPMLGVNPASVTGMLKRMGEEGYINYERYGSVTLTEKGRAIGKKTLKKHNTLKEFLMILGVSEEIAESDACRIEHVVHPETMEKLRNLVSEIKKESCDEQWKKSHNALFTLPSD